MVISRIGLIHAIEGVIALDTISSSCYLLVIVTHTSGNVSRLQLSGKHP